jgi:hypothetical protein
LRGQEPAKLDQRERAPLFGGFHEVGSHVFRERNADAGRWVGADIAVLERGSQQRLDRSHGVADRA